MTNTKHRIVSRAVSALVAVALATPALASVVSDLEGSKAAGALDDMGRRGFVQMSSYNADGGVYTYWWNSSSKKCVRLLTRDGRIDKTKDTNASDCGQKSSGGGNDAAAVIAGAALIAGIAALASKSHHRNDQEYSDSQSYADFERGHRDGLYAHAYHNYDNKEQYRQGYESGVRERDSQSAYRGNSYGKGGYQAHINVADLNYQDQRWAEGQLSRRGFKTTGGYDPQGGGRVELWWNGRTQQCLNVSSRSGQVNSVEEIDAGNCQ